MSYSSQKKVTLIALLWFENEPFSAMSRDLEDLSSFNVKLLKQLKKGARNNEKPAVFMFLCVLGFLL